VTAGEMTLIRVRREIADAYEPAHDQFQKELDDFLDWIRNQKSRTDPS
jgi:hypothetical protein